MNEFESELLLDNKDQGKLFTALLISIIAHALILALIPTLKKTYSRPIEIEFLSPNPQKKDSESPKIDVMPKQIISSTEAKESPAPENTRFLSDKDAWTDKEQIHRGLSAIKEPIKEKKTVHTQNHKQKSTPSNKLRLNEDEISKTVKFNSQAAEIQLPNPTRTSNRLEDRERTVVFEKSQPFSRNTALTLEQFGSSDYLPDIPDGEITLLNAKADRHAVFVRRVAMQVFAEIRKLNWAELAHQELNKLREFATVSAVISKKGTLLSVSVEQSSGSTAYDSLIVEAARAGTWDQNPPSEAADTDGNIHFIFKSRAWARYLGDQRLEQRWLLLGTGLK